MRGTAVIALFAGSILTTNNAAVAAPSGAAATDAGDTSAVVTATTSFALDLLAHVPARADENVFFSPLSVAAALEIARSGARGATAREMATTMHLDLDARRSGAAFSRLAASLEGRAQDGVELRVATRLWAQEGLALVPTFLAAYGERIGSVDFAHAHEAARTAINGWVESQTAHKIKDLVPSDAVDERTRLILTNALYFAGTWQTAFAPQATRGTPFHVAPGRDVADVPMMTQTTSLRLASDASATMVELPYHGALAMDLIVPRAAFGLEGVEPMLTATKLDGWQKALSAHTVQLTLPKITMRSALELGPTLQRLGMRLAFSRDADFSGISKATQLLISRVLHQSFVAVDEHGTEAAAATAVVMHRTRAVVAREPPLEVRADHPFLFLIRDQRDGAILFLGRYAQPPATTPPAERP